MKTTQLGDGILIDAETEIRISEAIEGTTLHSAQVHESDTIVHFIRSADGKTVTLDDDNMAEVAELFGVTEEELRSNLWP